MALPESIGLSENIHWISEDTSKKKKLWKKIVCCWLSISKNLSLLGKQKNLWARKKMWKSTLMDKDKAFPGGDEIMKSRDLR